ncbi:HlyD family secretion protein [Bordetella hinzii]|uniref:efflux RND transporter periplasmic adaptor subunit n=1 Tax=Bordetella hinzii TaxID=103855 RepID=UPI00041A7EC0|nr:efflux RND transporter periplasmic adaptor subunit [Bordetella hinzii]AKQ55359.1 putative efflux pump periplasmic linker TtgA precursor [Bordetella hinzii]KCB30651.1 efflux transporter, RND family, MFP subunit [Bordetella hinzii L60]SNV91089.1 HlyD family secretion protein [Bordetella hinzii]
MKISTLIRSACLACLANAAPAQGLPPDATLPPLTGAAPQDSLGHPMACLIEPFQVSELGSPSAGVLERVLVQRGDTVKKGQVVAELNTHVDEATLGLRRAEAAYLSRVVDRNADLYKRKLLPAGDYDEMSSRSRQAQLQVALQQAILAERSIKSPFDGVVAERYAGPGDRVNDNKIVKLAQIDPLVVKVVVPEGLYGQIKHEAEAQVNVNPAISGQALKAKVWRIDRVMDAASGTFTVLLTIPNKDHAIPAGIRCSIRF